jgi:Mce-associated membrane protein
MTVSGTRQEQVNAMTEPEGISQDGGDDRSLQLPEVGLARWLVPVVLAVVGIALFAVNQRHDSTAGSAEDARKVVTAHVGELLSYDHRTIDEELATESDWLAGAFASKYSALVTDELAPAAKQAEVTTKAAVSSGGVVSARHHEVELLLFVNVTTSSSGLSEPRVSGSRLLVTAQYIDGSWRITSLDPV